MNSFFFFLHVHTRGGKGTQTSDLYFIRRSLSRLNYLLGTKNSTNSTSPLLPCFLERKREEGDDDDNVNHTSNFLILILS
jgi:hypothetical protein